MRPEKKILISRYHYLSLSQNILRRGEGQNKHLAAPQNGLIGTPKLDREMKSAVVDHISAGKFKSKNLSPKDSPLTFFREEHSLSL